jgi:hypothetical protein
MATTKIADVVVPEVLGPMMAAEISNYLDIEKTGVAVADYDNVDIREGGHFANVPFYNQLDQSTGDEVLTDSTSMTPEKITTGKDIGVVCHRGKAWGSRDLAKILSGNDPMKSIAAQGGSYWARRIFNTVVQVLNALFASTGPLGTGATSPHVYNVAVATGTPVLFSFTGMLTAMNLIGDAMNDFSTVIMHSKVFTDLVNAQLISFPYNYDPTKVDPAALAKSGRFLGKDIIVTDTVPVDTTTSGFYKYTTYVMKKASIYIGRQKDLMTENDRDILAREDVLATSISFVPHVKLVKWNQTITNPTNAQLATATYWTSVANDHKFIGAVAIVTN